MPKKGAKLPAAHRKAISKALRKMYAAMTPAQRKEHLAPAHDALRGNAKAWPASRRKAMGDRLRGRTLTPQHKARVKAGLKRYWARVKAERGE